VDRYSYTFTPLNILPNITLVPAKQPKRLILSVF
jgi:hypothetical protein